MQPIGEGGVLKAAGERAETLAGVARQGFRPRPDPLVGLERPRCTMYALRYNVSLL